MLRVINGWSSASVVVVCDDCGAECAESRQHGQDNSDSVGWYGLSAIAIAKSHGYVDKLKGYKLSQLCPQCAKGEEVV